MFDLDAFHQQMDKIWTCPQCGAAPKILTDADPGMISALAEFIDEEREKRHAK